MQIAEIDFCAEDDLDAIMAIEASCFDMPITRERVAYDLANQGSVVYQKALLKGEAAGYAVISMDWDISHLLRVAVLPVYRRCGVGTQLLFASGVMAEEWGARKMLIDVRPSNDAARACYSRAGFAFRSRRRGYYRDGEDALVMIARLPLRITQEA